MDIEYQSAEAIKRFQEERLVVALDYLKENSPYYQRLFKNNHIDVSKIRTIEDLREIPFTEKKDLQLYNWDFLCCPREKVVDYVTTSGTLGEPVTFVSTEKDLQRHAFNEKKSFSCAGVKPGDIVQLMTTMDKRFIAGLAYFLGIRELGASIIRVGNGIPELQWDTIARLKPSTGIGLGLIVTLQVTVFPPSAVVAMIVAVPGATAVTTPSATVTTSGLEDVQLTF